MRRQLHLQASLRGCAGEDRYFTWYNALRPQAVPVPAFAGVTLLLAAVAVLASLVLALRAARVDPAIALR